MSKVEKKLHELGITLPETNPPAANYLPYKQSGNQIFIAGQTCRWNGEMQFTGKAGKDYDLATGIDAARLCGLNLLLQLKQACNGNLDKVLSCVKLTVYVQCVENFYDQAKIANGASNLMAEVFGTLGHHVRAAVGVSSLPSNSAIEIDGIFEVSP